MRSSKIRPAVSPGRRRSLPPWFDMSKMCIHFIGPAKPSIHQDHAMRLNKKTAVITGAASGIGKAIALADTFLAPDLNSTGLQR